VADPTLRYRTVQAICALHGSPPCDLGERTADAALDAVRAWLIDVAGQRRLPAADTELLLDIADLVADGEPVEVPA
jgi:hypothetical protein